MKRTKDEEQYLVTWLIRRLFRAMAHNANERLDRFGVTAADRAVLEFLYPQESLTVPDIATRYQVSRQHVQVTANRLLEKRLIVTKPNPAHKRSSLLALTASGRKMFERIRQSDDAAVREAFAGINAADVTKTRKTLQRLQQQLQKGDPA